MTSEVTEDLGVLVTRLVRCRLGAIRERFRRAARRSRAVKAFVMKDKRTKSLLKTGG